MKPLAYLRYGDDWLCFAKSQTEAGRIRAKAQAFLDDKLLLTVNSKIDHIQPVPHGVSYLGVDLWPHGRRLQPQIRERVNNRLTKHNVASYRSLIATHEASRQLKKLDWQICELL
jgi:hypothetical protein